MAVMSGLLPRPATRGHEAPRSGRRAIRAANPNEAAVLSCLHRSLARDAFAFEACIDADPAANRSIVLVCEVSEAIAGYLCVGDPNALLGPAPSPGPQTETPARWELRALGVAPQFRRTGVATDLWRASMSRIPAGIVTVSGDIRPDRAAATAWLRARGFDLDPVLAPVVPEARIPLFGMRDARFEAAVATLQANLAAPRKVRSRIATRRL